MARIAKLQGEKASTACVRDLSNAIDSRLLNLLELLSSFFLITDLGDA